MSFQCQGVGFRVYARVWADAPAREVLLVAWLVEAVVYVEDGAVIAPVPEASPHRLI